VDPLQGLARRNASAAGEDVAGVAIKLVLLDNGLDGGGIFSGEVRLPGGSIRHDRRRVSDATLADLHMVARFCRHSSCFTSSQIVGGNRLGCDAIRI